MNLCKNENSAGKPASPAPGDPDAFLILAVSGHIPGSARRAFLQDHGFAVPTTEDPDSASSRNIFATFSIFLFCILP